MNDKKFNNNYKVFIIFLTSFVLWIIFTAFIGNYTNIALLKTKNYQIESTLDDQLNVDLSKYDSVFNLIKNYYYDIDNLTNTWLIDWSINWLVDWIWDKHSDYLTKEEYIQFNENLSWDFEWIWAVIELHPLWVQIDRILKWSPAKSNDLRTWDIIITANSIELSWLWLIEAVDNIKWPAWTNVVLEIIREWETEILTKDIIRNKIKIPSVEHELLDDNIWYISINMFWIDTFVDFQSALLDLKDTDWIIIDLRDNWGWLLMSAVEILSKFIENWNDLVVTKYKESNNNHSYKSNNYWYLYKWKIVILINENSASASEIVAWALSDYDKAILVWKKSYWKWSVQEPFELDDWSMVKLTIAKWFTPKWVNIDEEWINPDIEVWFEDEDFENNYDRQKEKAIEVLKNFISKQNIDLVKSDYLVE